MKKDFTTSQKWNRAKTIISKEKVAFHGVHEVITSIEEDKLILFGKDREDIRAEISLKGIDQYSLEESDSMDDSFNLKFYKSSDHQNKSHWFSKDMENIASDNLTDEEIKEICNLTGLNQDNIEIFTIQLPKFMKHYLPNDLPPLPKNILDEIFKDKE